MDSVLKCKIVSVKTLKPDRVSPIVGMDILKHKSILV